MKKIIGGLLFIVGSISLISSQTGMTGNLISEVAGGLGSALGLACIIGGLLIVGLEKNMGGKFEKRYEQRFETMYQQRVAEGKKRINEEMRDKTYFTPGTKGRAFAYRVQELKKKVEQDLLKERKATEKIYKQRMAEGRKRINEEMRDKTYFTPGTKGQAFIYRLQKLEKELRNDLLSYGE